MKKIMTFILSLGLISSLSSVGLNAAYNYSPLGDVIASAEALIAARVVDSSNLTDVNGQDANLTLGTLVDVCSFEDRIYLVDNSSSAVHVLDGQYRYLCSFGTEDGIGKLNKPSGIFVTSEFVYVADTENFRIAIYDHDYVYVKEINTPNDPTFKQTPEDPEGYDFKPLKVAVDRTGRVYAIADQIFEGIIDFHPAGSFSRYVGANTVTLSVWDAFWLRFTSEEQRQAQGYRLATTFLNLNIDSKGYLYTLSDVSEGSKVIKKLNFKGIDILSRNGYVPQIGDAMTIVDSGEAVPTGPSQLIDIDLNENGTYCVLDGVRGRIFTYDFEGNLLYIGGQIGNVGGAVNNQSKLFLSPEALCYDDDRILVVDSLNKNLVVFEYTEFASLVNEATRLYQQGDYQAAGAIWEQVLVLNTNYYLAYAGIGKAQLRDGDYRSALVNLKLGYDEYNYSQAYQQYRYDQLTVIFPYVLGVVIAGVVYLFIKSIRKSVATAKKEEKDE